MSLSDWVDVVSKGGIITLMGLIVFGGYKGWWVYGWQYRAKVQESEDWKHLALGSIDTIKQTLEVIEPAVQRLAKRA